MIEISKDKSRLDVDMIHGFLQKSYWANTRSKEAVQTTIEECTCFGVYLENKQIGFARVLTDKVVMAYLMDVFILKAYNGQGYGQALMKAIMEDPEFDKLTVWLLKTSDAHTLYSKFGFKEINDPDKFMVKFVNK